MPQAFLRTMSALEELKLSSDRVAGHETDGMQLVPRDPWRYGYRIWAEKKTGLVVKLQTLDGAGRAPRVGREP